MIAKRIFDMFFSIAGIVFILPLLIIIAIIILLDSKGEVIYRQKRVGRNNSEFKLLKFRTMRTGSDKASLLTIGDHDSRITRCGQWLRKYKLLQMPPVHNNRLH